MDERKKAIPMQLFGEAVKKHAASLDREIKSNYQRLKAEITSKLKHAANEMVEKHIFNMMEHEEEETIKAFLMRLRLQTKKSNNKILSRVLVVGLNDGQKQNVIMESEDISESLISSDRIVVGVSNVTISLISHSSLTTSIA